MEPIVVDAALRERLLGVVSGPVEIRDQYGRVLGTYEPAIDPGLYGIIGAVMADEELDRKVREGPHYTADQVMERLRGLRRTV